MKNYIKMPIIKNIIICALALVCALLTIRLWFGDIPVHGLFYLAPAQAASQLAHPMAPEIITSARLEVSINNQNQDDNQNQNQNQNQPQTITTIYSNLKDRQAWQTATQAISALIDEGSFSHTTTTPPPAKKIITIHYNFPMSSSFFREFFGQRPGFLSSIFTSFNTLTISPTAYGASFTFSSFSSNGGEYNHHIFNIENTQINNDLTALFEYLQTQMNQTPPQALPQTTTPQITAKNPIDAPLLLHTVLPFIDFFFPNPANIGQSMINGVYTYKDNFRVVKFYPNNIVQYTALQTQSPTTPPSLTSSLLAALNMLNRDKAAMQARGTPMNNVFLVGYSTDPIIGQWNFYFDYIASGQPIQIDLDTHHLSLTSQLSHPLQIQVTNNTVTSYTRLMLNFH